MASDKTEQFNEQQFGREFPPETPWHELLQAAHARGHREALEKAAQKCRYMLKHQNFPGEWGNWSEYEKGFKVACELCEKSIAALLDQEGGSE